MFNPLYINYGTEPSSSITVCGGLYTVCGAIIQHGTVKLL